MKIFASLVVAMVAMVALSPVSIVHANGIAPRRGAAPFTFDDVFPEDRRRLHEGEDHAGEDADADADAVVMTTTEAPDADTDAPPPIAPLIDSVSYTTAPPAASDDKTDGSSADAAGDAGEDEEESRRRNLRSL